MNNKQLLAYYGLKWNPFLPNIPVEALWHPPQMNSFIFRLENMTMNGGFALISGEPGLGKSKTLQIIAHQFSKLDEVIVGVMERPQSSVSDFYREMGVLFGVNLSPANRYGGFKDLRERWKNHVKTTLFRPILLIDEAQEMLSGCLNELRLLNSVEFDSQNLLTTVICGDDRLPDRFRTRTLVSLGSRMQFRLKLDPYTRDDLLDYMGHCLNQAGAPHLMTKTLIKTVVDHCAGNLRVLNNMAAELLTSGIEKELSQLDEKLFIEVFSRQPPNKKS
ncbi:ATP-binding protein [Desulfobacula sp.]|uniref:ExeA family protein n=1 Tax=Desulfobacula sp. TaxID=2593537 RepID=UPI00261DBC1D|nr:ATP-binding protein [Desulfobacula sp.]